MDKKKFLELDILRVIAILLVVFGHCCYSEFGNSVGSLSLNDTPMLHEPIYLIASKIVTLISMPLT